ncbi:phage tail protein [Vibrio sp. H11]|uniref:phage tail protein n=1 Tax=Vibrio sp. H11 TaxID=2565928 RepID=UPI0010A6ACED|nr:phage tail protein [Vibrio sp. H11]
MSEIKDPGTYAKLPAGTRVSWGQVSDETADLKLLKDADSVGVTGKTSGFVACTRLIDTETKSIADLPDGPEKELVFLDDPDDADLQAFLDAAENLQTVKVRIEFPNTRWADMILALGGWSHRELDKNQPMYLVVSGKQNGITRGKTAVV